MRQSLGIGLVGKGTIGSPVHMFFRAPSLLQSCGQKPATFFLPIDDKGLWGNIRDHRPGQRHLAAHGR